MPLEMELVRALDRYGAPAVLGRLLYVNEMQRIEVVESVVFAHAAKFSALNPVTWATEHPELNKLLIEAQLEINDGN